ncbi:p47 protein isoform c [Coprinopsis sp. MPI-PUGE-AT-0042]|nr:p47 protein isoform c [Coprinopsis sp. MPI-PUGE-AT-0042]
MSSNDENRNRPAQGYRPSGPTRVGRIGDWNNSDAPASSSGGSSGRRIATLGGMGGGGGGPSSRRSDDDDSDEEEKKEGETWFSGGERSGINVQNPNAPGAAGSAGGLISDIFRQATENSRARAARGEGAPAQSTPRFTGGGYTLGNEEEMSRYIPDENAEDDEENVQTRFITFWRNGFTIADGELREYEEPENRAILARIMQGDAPIELLNVERDQPVDLQIANKRNEDYTPPPQPVAFRGSGNRLGAPVPAVASSSSQAGPSSSAPAQPTSPPRTAFEVDQTQPTTNVQIRFADGSKMVAKMNLTHTVGDIRGIINASQPVSVFQPYAISTTFPNRTLDDNDVTIEAAGLKNSVVVQRWVG